MQLNAKLSSVSQTNAGIELSAHHQFAFVQSNLTELSNFTQLSSNFTQEASAAVGDASVERPILTDSEDGTFSKEGGEFLPTGLWEKVKQALPHHWMPVIFVIGMLKLSVCAFVDTGKGSTWAEAESENAQASFNAKPDVLSVVNEPIAVHGQVDISCNERSLLTVAMLTSYRLYTGFLGATWVPYLVAKEGQSLLRMDHILSTASFMGIAKLIYGFSIFLNPLFGILSDRMAAHAPRTGRVSFLLAGLGVSGVGIYAAKIASETGDIIGYLVACCLWMLGEAIADITSETIAPELLPPSQYDLASAVRSIHHLVGALLGYAALIVAAVLDIHWRWLYFAYLALMLICAATTVVFMRGVCPLHSADRSDRGSGAPALSLVFEAYFAPMNYSGGFPRSCLCMFIFSLGTGPLFFTFLMLHDLVRIKSTQKQQLHFSLISVAFLLGACITAIYSGVSSGDSQTQPEQDQHDASSSDGEEIVSSTQDTVNTRSIAELEGSQDTLAPNSCEAPPNPCEPCRDASVTDSGQVAEQGSPSNHPASSTTSANRWRMMYLSAVAFGLACTLIPVVGVPRSKSVRLIGFYVVSFVLGLSFGAVYSRFQSCIWSLLPPHVDVANAMGFAALAKLGGAGCGNFLAGLILDAFRQKHHASHGHSYSNVGWILMTWLSAACVFLCAYLIIGIERLRRPPSQSKAVKKANKPSIGSFHGRKGSCR